MPITKRREFGNKGELLAEKFLKDRGYTIIEKNRRVGNLGEIDIITKKSGGYVFCEVKTRDVSHETDYPIGFSIDERKRNALKMACEVYLIEIGMDWSMWQVDAILITIDRKTDEIKNMEHLENILWERYY